VRDVDGHDLVTRVDNGDDGDTDVHSLGVYEAHSEEQQKNDDVATREVEIGARTRQSLQYAAPTVAIRRRRAPVASRGRWVNHAILTTVGMLLIRGLTGRFHP